MAIMLNFFIHMGQYSMVERKGDLAFQENGVELISIICQLFTLCEFLHF